MKRKVAYRKEQKISKYINVILISAFLLFVFFTFYQVYKSDLLRAASYVAGKEKSPINAIKDVDYGIGGFQKVAENNKYIMFADFTTGEIKIEELITGKVWYSNPPDRENDTVVAIKSSLSAQLTVSCIDLEIDNLKEENNYAGSIQMGGMESELIENGVKFWFSFPTTGVIIPVQYTLNEEGMLAEILVDEIQELWKERYIVESISLLPWFGAGSLEDAGYLFVPDGSGALIEFNNGKQRFQSYAAPIYGTNLTMGVQKKNVSEQIYMPVFGMKCNENAFLGVVISGETNGNICATTSRKLSSYNQIYTKVTIREYKFMTMDREGNTNTSHGSDHTPILLEGQNYAVQYFFLDKDEADYSGMSKNYREYLYNKNALKKSKLADEQYIILDLYGAVSIEKYVMGVKKPVVTAMTTYDDVCNIVKELKECGINNLIINYIGALDGGLNNKMNNKVKTESILGSSKDFQRMKKYLEEEGVILFVETNPIDIYKNGNGYSLNGDSVKALYNGNAFCYKYTLDSQEKINESRWRLMKPGLIPGFFDTYAQSAKKNDVNNLSFSRIGEVLYSDYTQEETFASRAKTKQYWEEAMAEAQNVAEHLMVHGGNIFCATYADIITDISTSGSYYDMEDQSIPFYQMVLHGSNVLAVDAINSSVDYHMAFLKAQELGCSLKYNLIAEDVTDLVGTEYNDMVSYSYEYWKDTIVQQYHMLQDANASLSGEIVYHEQLNQDVTMTKYISGASIIVNYGEDAFVYDDQKIEGRNFLIVKGAVE